ncbi:hypothetical protein N8945_01590 [Candidatus Pelagibacter sp.]|nr:hypothetical protein [Candidatus Pelagibacter sp.]
MKEWFDKEWLKDITSGEGTIYTQKKMNGAVIHNAKFNIKKIVDYYFQFLKQSAEENVYSEKGYSLIYTQSERYFLELNFGINEMKIDAIEEILMRSGDIDDTLKTLLLSMVLQRIDNQDKQLRVRIRELIKRYHKSDIRDVMKLYCEIKGSNVGKLNKIKSSEEQRGKKLNKSDRAETKMTGRLFKSLSRMSLLDYDKIDNNEWITIYRGFNTRDGEGVRFTNNKKKSDWYRQKEGMGFSFTLDKYVAWRFSAMYHFRTLHSFNDGYYEGSVGDQDYRELLKELSKDVDRKLGRMTIGRYVIHRDNIFSYCNDNNEREVMCDYRNARMINYVFLSDLKLNNDDWDYIKETHYVFSKDRTHQNHVKKFKNLWVSKHWKTDYKVKKDQESLLLKVKS